MQMRHIVKFFDDHENLCHTVAAFLVDGLAAGEPALVVATPAHRAGILRALAKRLAVAGQDSLMGDLLLVDAAETLSRFMDGDIPDARRFERAIGDLVAPWSSAGPLRIHAYGEMVDLLCQQGRVEAAIRVEHLWDDVAARGVSLLCGYRLHNVAFDLDHLQRVCCLHTAVLAPSNAPKPLGSAS